MNGNNLRPYQNNSVIALRKSFSLGHKRVCLCAPTGAGKTRMFCEMAVLHLKKSQKHKVLILTHRIEILRQAGKDFENIQEIKSGHEPDLTQKILVAMAETLHRRAEKYTNFFASVTMVICDEVHVSLFDKLYPFFSESCSIIGATATPHRAGKQLALDNFYTDIVQEIDTPELISLGFLSRPKTYGVDIDLKGIKKKGEDYDPKELAQRYSEKKVYDGVIENYKRICPDSKSILFAANIDSAKEVCVKFNLSGIPSRCIDSKTISDWERRQTLQWFKETKNGVLCNVSILTAGFDQPDIRTVILYLSTCSITKYLQMIGRGSRIIPGEKDEFTILDFGNNTKTHNFWEAPRTWALSKKKKKDKTGAAPAKICPGCNAMLQVSLLTCPYCNYIFKQKDSGKNEFAELMLLSPPEIWKVAKTKTVEEQAKMAKAKLLKPMAVLHSITSKDEGLSFVKEMGYKPSFAYINRHRFKCFESL